MLKSFLESEANLAKRDIIEGKIVKEKIKAKRIPTTIIFPKSITGFISLTDNEAKATIVVKAV